MHIKAISDWEIKDAINSAWGRIGTYLTRKDHDLLCKQLKEQWENEE